jgi:hypothetical protein
MNDQHHAVVTLPLCAITKIIRLVLLRDKTVVYCETGNKVLVQFMGEVWGC